VIVLYKSPNGHRLHHPRENPDRGMVDAGAAQNRITRSCALRLGRRLCHDLHPEQHDTFVSVGARWGLGERHAR
jgi:hypothetical protein